MVTMSRIKEADQLCLVGLYKKAGLDLTAQSPVKGSNESVNKLLIIFLWNLKHIPALKQSRIEAMR